MVVVLLVFLALVFSGGCSRSGRSGSGGTSGEAIPEGAVSMDKFTITYFDYNEERNTSEVSSKYYDEVERLWYKKYPNSTLEITGLADGVTGLALLQSQLAAGTAAEVFRHQTRTASFARAGYLYDLSDQPWVSKIVEGAKPDCIVDGKVWAAPVNCVGWGLYYNKAIYEDELKLTVPKTFQEFLDNCEVIKKSGRSPLIIGSAEGWPFQGLYLSFSSFIYGSNPNFAKDLYNGKASLAGKEIYDTFNAIKILYDRGYFDPASTSVPFLTGWESVYSGKAVMSFNGAPSRDEKVPLGFFYIPDFEGNTYVPVIGGTVYSVNAKYEYASTRGVDLLNCLIAESALSIKLKDDAPSAYEGMKVEYTSLAGTRYQEAYDKGPVVLQITSWLPPSVFEQYQQITSSILSGKGFTQAMLDNMQRTYEADKANVNVLQ